MIQYETNRKKLNDYFFKIIYIKIDKFGIDYIKTILTLMSDVGVSRRMAIEYLDSLIDSGKLKETRILELPGEELKKREEESLKLEKEAIKEVETIQEAQPILKDESKSFVEFKNGGN